MIWGGVRDEKFYDCSRRGEQGITQKFVSRDKCMAPYIVTSEDETIDTEIRNTIHDFTNYY